jgi:iron complex transport system ATP-binding protein
MVVAAGPLEEVLTEEVVSSTFSMPIRLTHEDDRWAARRRDPRSSV